MTQAKVVNYTPAQTQDIIAQYQSCGTDIDDASHEARKNMVDTLAKKYGKTDRSIRSKLVTEKDENGDSIYIARSKVSEVTGEKPEKKEVLAQRLVDAVPFNISADSVAKMNKLDIQAFLTHFNDEIVDENENDSQEGETETE